MNLVANEDIRDMFLGLTNEDDYDMVRIVILYLITSYLFSTSYKEVVENYLFDLVKDFHVIEMFIRGKSCLNCP